MELDYGKMGMRIRQVRKAKGWSQDELAKKCGISMSFLGHIERGTRIMSLETFTGICKALDGVCRILLTRCLICCIKKKKMQMKKRKRTAIPCMSEL